MWLIFETILNAYLVALIPKVFYLHPLRHRHPRNLKDVHGQKYDALM